MLAQIGGPEALRELSEQDEDLEERLNAWVGKTQAGRALAAGCHRSVDGLQSIFAEDAVVAQPLDLDQPQIRSRAALQDCAGVCRCRSRKCFLPELVMNRRPEPQRNTPRRSEAKPR